MIEKSKVIFGNTVSDGAYRKAVRGKQKYLRRFGDDSNIEYHLATSPCEVLAPLGVQQLIRSDTPQADFSAKSLIVGNIRMGFGHYRISMAIASAAHALGCTPLWLDLNSFPSTTCTKVISAQNDLYSLGSRISQRSHLFNKLVWEPMNSEGFRKLSYNAADQKTTELMTPLFRDIPKDTPFVATHVWPSQAAIHAGMTHVVNAVPDNWQMALHLSEGALHTVQTPSAWLGYKTLRGMDKKRQLEPMPDGTLFYTGHYIDHELVSNIEADCARRLARIKAKKPRRYLLTVGGAGAQQALFCELLRTLLPEVKAGRAAVFVNVGDHRDVWDGLLAALPEMQHLLSVHFDDYAAGATFAENALDGEVNGIHAFCDSDIFAAVYLTNLLMRASDVLITKPSELAFYPVPKLLIHRVGGHEAWGAIHSAELGDGTFECDTLAETTAMLQLLQTEDEALTLMCQNILSAGRAGIYDGAYRVVKLALGETVSFPSETSASFGFSCP